MTDTPLLDTFSSPSAVVDTLLDSHRPSSVQNTELRLTPIVLFTRLGRSGLTGPLVLPTYYVHIY